MKALTLHQPWASFVALGVKTIETRSWSTEYRGPLAIHAGARQVHTGKFLLLARQARIAKKITVEQERAFRSLDVPFGSVVATCELVDVVPVTVEEQWSSFIGAHGRTWKLFEQRPYGDFTPGRYAWLLADVKPLDDPVPAKGKQGLWSWEP